MLLLDLLHGTVMLDSGSPYRVSNAGQCMQLQTSDCIDEGMMNSGAYISLAELSIVDRGFYLQFLPFGSILMLLTAVGDRNGTGILITVF